MQLQNLTNTTQGNGAADCATTYLHPAFHGDEELAEKYKVTFITLSRAAPVISIANECLALLLQQSCSRSCKKTEFLLANVFDKLVTKNFKLTEKKFLLRQLFFITLLTAQ